MFASLTRRTIVIGSAAYVGAAALPHTAAATPDALAATLKSILGEKLARAGRIKLDIPELAENGNSVPLTITVDSPMTA